MWSQVWHNSVIVAFITTLVCHLCQLIECVDFEFVPASVTAEAQVSSATESSKMVTVVRIPEKNSQVEYSHTKSLPRRKQKQKTLRQNKGKYKSFWAWKVICEIRCSRIFSTFRLVNGKLCSLEKYVTVALRKKIEF